MSEKLTRHHTLFERPDFRRNVWHHKLRCLPGLIIPIPMESIHRPLHRSLPRHVPLPDIEATKYFVQEVVLPPNRESLFQTMEQAIGWFAMTNNEPTAEHLYMQKEFIRDRL
jgi:hypothetical protein